MNSEPSTQASSSESEQGPKTAPRRPLLRVAAALQKEGRKIVAKHADRLSGEVVEEMRACIAGIDNARAAADADAMTKDAERLDLLLQEHAKFARKSGLRELVENLGFALTLALSLRACLYEPFSIPSISMVPTLRVGDFILVNKFLHGVQVPFTNHIVLEDLVSPVARGEVIVFRYPHDEKLDYIKRVIGIPGDTIKFEGDGIWIRPKGASEFQKVQSRKLNRRCKDDAGEKEIAGCDVYEEVLGDHTYVVRYMRDVMGMSFHEPTRIIQIPEKSYLVMGDNRNRSEDSRRWMVTTEAVQADALLSDKDLRDITPERDIADLRADQPGQTDPKVDSVKFTAQHLSPGHAVALDLWRTPLHGGLATFQGRQRVHASSTWRPVQLSGLLADAAKSGVSQAKLEKTKGLGYGIDRLVLSEDATSYIVVAYLAPLDAVVELKCGKLSCATTTDLAVMVADVVAALHERPQASASEILRSPVGATYEEFSSLARDRVAGRYWQASLVPKGKPEPSAREIVAVTAVRGSFEGAQTLTESSFVAAGTQRERAELLVGAIERTYLFELADEWRSVSEQGAAGESLFAELRCGKSVCKTAQEARALAKSVASRLALASEHAGRLRELLVSEDAPGLVDAPTMLPANYPWDHVAYEGRIQGVDYETQLQVQLTPPEGLAAASARIQAAIVAGNRDDSLSNDGWRAKKPDGWHFVFTRNRSVFHLRCGHGLCPNEEVAQMLAKRVFDNAADPTHFIDPDGVVPSPFVPRGNIKGRAEVIWLPLKRFGTKLP